MVENVEGLKARAAIARAEARKVEAAARLRSAELRNEASIRGKATARFIARTRAADGRTRVVGRIAEAAIARGWHPAPPAPSALARYHAFLDVAAASDRAEAH